MRRLAPRRYYEQEEPAASVSGENAEEWTVPGPGNPETLWHHPSARLHGFNWVPPYALLPDPEPVPRWRLGEATVDGYDYHPADQPAYLAVMIEKTSFDNVLVPLCEGLGIDLWRGSGFASVTAVISLLRFAEEIGRPSAITTRPATGCRAR